MTPKCEEEINKIKENIVVLKRKSDEILTRERSESAWIIASALRKERFRIEDRIYKKEEKIRDLEKMEFSTSEQSKILRESDSFTLLELENSIGMKNVTRVGFSKVVNSNVVINFTRYTDLMRNVKGCGGLAGKKQINSITTVTEEEVIELKKKGRVNRTLFGGCHETVTPIV